MTNNDYAAITELLQTAKNIAVVGLSSKPSRPSYSVARMLQSSGYRIFPVNPNESQILGEKCYATLAEIPEKIDIVDVFRRSDFVADFMDAVIGIHPRAVWMQEGVVDEASAERARRAGIFVVMDLCIAVEIYRRR